MRTIPEYHTHYTVLLQCHFSCQNCMYHWCPLLVHQSWGGSTFGLPILDRGSTFGRPILDRGSIFGRPITGPGPLFGPPILDRVHWSVKTGPSSCYIELYTVYLSGTIPASYCRAFNRRGLPGRLSLACSSRQLRSLLVCGREVYYTTEEHIATARRENSCNQVFEQDKHICTDASSLKRFSELGVHPVHFWQRRSTFRD